MVLRTYCNTLFKSKACITQRVPQKTGSASTLSETAQRGDRLAAKDQTRLSHRVVVCWLLNVPAACYSVSQGRICSDNCTCCHTEIEVADQTFYLTQSQYADTWPTSPSADSRTPGAWQGSHWSASFKSLV